MKNRFFNPVITGMLLISLNNTAIPAQAQGKKTQPQLVKNAYSLAESNNQFAFDLYKQLAVQEGNLFFSPFSISTALAITYNGAAGKTKSEMAKTLHFEQLQKNIPQAFHVLLDSIKPAKNRKDLQLNISNALWAQKKYIFLNSYIKLCRDYYSASVQNADFTTNKEREKSRKSINQWVEKQTNGKIKDLLQTGAIDAMTRMVITNAVYFYGSWAEKFDEKRTKQDTFHLADKSFVLAPFMHKTFSAKYFENQNLQMAELPYFSGEYSMIIFLPKAPTGLEQVNNDLTNNNFKFYFSKSTQKEIQFSIPKFKLSGQFDLGQKLAGMGMPMAFSNKADFSGMTGHYDLKISKVIHKAFIEVNEKGTEAAAATGVIMALKSAYISNKIIFKADHPFFFIIRENSTGSILFMGKLAKPETNL